MTFRGLDYHLGELDVFIYHCNCKGNRISQKSRPPKSPHTIWIIIFRDFVVCIIISENLICWFTIGNTFKIIYPTNPGSPGLPNHINCYILRFGRLGYLLGELNLFLYDCNCKGNCIFQKPRDPGPRKIINYYMFGFGGLDYHLGELDLFAHHWTYMGNRMSQQPRGRGSPKPY